MAPLGQIASGPSPRRRPGGRRDRAAFMSASHARGWLGLASLVLATTAATGSAIDPRENLFPYTAIGAGATVSAQMLAVVDLNHDGIDDVVHV